MATATPAPAAAPGAPTAAALADNPINPARRYGLTDARSPTFCGPTAACVDAVSLTLCRPTAACEAQPRPPELRDAVIEALDRDLAPRPAPVPPESPGDALALSFGLPGGRQIAIDYDRRAGLLRLPGADGWVAAPPELARALAKVESAP